jgi:predicted SprT family Zn-dependent metalloprotease
MKNHKNPDGTYNGIGLMSEMTGLTKDDVQAIWDEVVSNEKKLRACKEHDFSIKSTGRTILDERYGCSRCKGEVGFERFERFERWKKGISK